MSSERAELGRPTVVECRDLSKIYRRYSGPWRRIWELLGGGETHQAHAALENVSFDLARGEALGVVGENGAGKSTLLKILAGVLRQSSGEVVVHGTISSILELGSGFHPEFTGLQNARLNAAILGLGQGEVRQRMPQILEFAELGDAIDQPIKSYSTGMVMRLAFAIATGVEPDVLIVDEALSVGDGYFQKKSMDRMSELVDGGTTLLFCSHAMYYIASFCRRALWLRDGRVQALGDSKEVIASYEQFLSDKERPGERPDQRSRAQADRPRGPAWIRSMALLGAAGEELESPVFAPGDTLRVRLEWHSRSIETAFHVAVGFNRRDGVDVFTCLSTGRDSFPLSGSTEYAIELCVPELPLMKGDFDLYFAIGDERARHVYDERRLENAFQVRSDTYSFGLVTVPHDWRLAPREVE